MRAERTLALLSRVLPVLLLAAAPFLALGTLRAVRDLRTNVLDWLPERSPELETLRWYDARFGSDQLLVVTWPGATLGDRRLDDAVRQLDAARNGDGERLFRQVVSGRTALSVLTGPLRLPREEAVRRMSGWFVGPDGETTALLCLASPAGAANPSLAEARARAAASAAGVPSAEVRVAGSLVDATAIDRASSEGLGALGAAAAALCLVAAFLLVRDPRSAAAVVTTAAFAATGTAAGATALGLRLDALGIMAPVLGFVLSVSGGIHLTGYLDEEKRRVGGAAAVLSALRRAARPLALAQLTTLAGFASLAFATTTPVRRFGWIGSGTVLVVTLSLLVVWPALALAFRAAGSAGPREDARAPGRFANGVVRHRGPILLAWAFLVLAALPGFAMLRTAVGIGELLPPGHDLVRTYRYLEEHLGAAIPVEVVVAFPSGSGHREAYRERTRTIGMVRTAIAGVPGVGGTLAADTFASHPAPPGPPSGPSDRFFAERLAFVRPEPDGSELWRVSARVSAFGRGDFGELTERIEEAARQALAGRARDVIVAGGVTMVARAQARLLRDLAASAAVAVVTVVLILAVGLGSLRAALLAAVPNVAPLLVVFGALGLAGVAVDVGIAMTASVALGLAVDATCHILARFLRERQAGHDRPVAAARSLSAAGRPAARAAALCVAPLAVFALADFLPFARFGWLMAVLLAVAAAADLVLLPALLAGRASRWVEAATVRPPDR